MASWDQDIMDQKLLTASEKGNIKEVELCIKNRANLECRDRIGEYTPLMLAAGGGHLEVVTFLVTHGSQLETTYPAGLTPLMLAAEGGHLEVVTFLVTHGSLLEATDMTGRTPLMWAAEGGHLEVVTFLVTHGSRLEATGYGGGTALHLAAQYGHIDVTKWLINQGCSPLVKTKQGKTPYHLVKRSTYCSEEEKEELMDFLKTVMSKPSPEVTPDTHLQEPAAPVVEGIPDDILDCIPSDEIVDRLAPLIGKIVFQLGIELGLSVADLESIKEKCDRDLTAQNKEVLFAWRKDRTVKPTIRVLEQAFVNIGKGARCLKEVVKDVDPNTLKAVEIVTDRIRENKNRIIQDIQISQILDHMMTHLVISADDRLGIEHYPRHDDQNKALLDIVIKRREPAYSVFVDGLRNYGYEDIANDLIYHSQETSPSTTLVSDEDEGFKVWNVPLYKVRLQKNYVKVITDIQHESIVDHLISKEVVSVDDGKKIESGKTPQEKNRNLMDMLLRKNEQGFNEFLKALRKDSIYADLAEQIEKTEVTSTDMATLHKCLK